MLILSLFFNSVSLQAVPQEAGRLSGLLRAVGYDGALEVLENPAYLVLPQDNKRYALAWESSAAWSYSPNLNVLQRESLAGSYQTDTLVAFSAADLFGGNWGLGVLLGMEGRPRISIASPQVNFNFGTISSLRRASNLPPLVKLSGKVNNFDFRQDSEPLGMALALAITYKLNAENALGISLYQSYSTPKMNELGRGQLYLPLEVQLTNQNREKQRELISALMVGYLARFATSELGLSLIASGWHRNFKQQNVTQQTVIPAFSINNLETYQEKYYLSNWLVPQLNMGIAHNLLPLWRLYAEVGFSPPLAQIDRFGRYHNGKVVRYETTNPEGTKIILAGGSAIRLTTKWLIFLGYHHTSQNSDRTYRSNYIQYYLLRKQEISSQSMQIGISYLFRENIGLICGSQTTHYRTRRTDIQLENNQPLSSKLKSSFWETSLYLALHYNPAS